MNQLIIQFNHGSIGCTNWTMIRKSQQFNNDLQSSLKRLVCTCIDSLQQLYRTTNCRAIRSEEKFSLTGFQSTIPYDSSRGYAFDLHYKYIELFIQIRSKSPTQKVIWNWIDNVFQCEITLEGISKCEVTLNVAVWQ